MKKEIQEFVNMFDLSAPTAKSLGNRLDSALGKEGTPAQKLSMASKSLMKFADDIEIEEEQNLIYAFGAFVQIASEIAKDTSKPKAQKSTRENWHDSDSDEAQEILAKKSAPKPRTKKAEAPALNAEVIAQLLEALTARG